jgi:hypothetical protein
MNNLLFLRVGGGMPCVVGECVYSYINNIDKTIDLILAWEKYAGHAKAMEDSIRGCEVSCDEPGERARGGVSGSGGLRAFP